MERQRHMQSKTYIDPRRLLAARKLKGPAQRNYPTQNDYRPFQNQHRRGRELPEFQNRLPARNLSNKDKMDIRFDLKGVQHKILCDKLEKDLINIVPHIIDNISDDVVEITNTINEEQEQELKMRERLNLT